MKPCISVKSADDTEQLPVSIFMVVEGRPTANLNVETVIISERFPFSYQRI